VKHERHVVVGPERSALRWAAGVSVLAVALAGLGGAWFGWSPNGEGQLTFAGRSWHSAYCGPSCNGSYRFNVAVAATILAPFVLVVAFLLAARRVPGDPATAGAHRPPGVGRVVAGEAIRWLIAAATAAAVGASSRVYGPSWNNFGGAEPGRRVVFDSYRFNALWAAGAAMIAMLAAAVGGTFDVRRAARAPRIRLAAVALCWSGAVSAGYVLARWAGAGGSLFDAMPYPGPTTVKSVNWMVFAAITAGATAAAAIRIAVIVTDGDDPARRRRRAMAAAASVAVIGCGTAVGLASVFRLRNDRLFDWSGRAATGDRFNWTLFGLIAGPAVFAAVAIGVRGVVSGGVEPARVRRASLALAVFAAGGVVVAGWLAHHVGSDAARMSVLRGGDDGAPRFNWFVFLAASGPFVAAAGAAGALWLPAREPKRVSVAPDSAAGPRGGRTHRWRDGAAPFGRTESPTAGSYCPRSFWRSAAWIIRPNARSWARCSGSDRRRSLTSAS
jgi:hypothetical protein